MYVQNPIKIDLLYHIKLYNLSENRSLGNYKKFLHGQVLEVRALLFSRNSYKIVPNVPQGI